MNLNQDSIVAKICGFKSNIKLSELSEIFDLDVDEVIESLEENDQYELDEWLIEYYTNEINCSVVVQDDYGVTGLLKKFFGDEYLMMVSTRFSYENFNNTNHESHIIKWHGDMSEDFVENIIEGNEIEIKRVITKGHMEHELTDINETNLLTKDEKKQINLYEKDNDNYERYLDARYSHYFMKKNDFNETKWWLGWTYQE